MKNKQTVSTELKSAQKLFEQTSVFKSLLKVVFLAVIVSFASGTYVFADQVLMTKILPTNQLGFVSSTLNKIGWYELIEQLNTNQIIDKYSLLNNFLTEKDTITSIVRIANSAIAPITLICTALSLLIGLGTSIPYSKALGEKNNEKIKDIWTNGFYNCLVISIFTTLLFIALLYVIIPSQISDNVPDDTTLAIKDFLAKKREISIQFAINYSLIILGFNFLNNYAMLFISLLNSEGKNSIPTFVVLSANMLNILFDYVLLQFTTIGMVGSAIATTLSYVVSNLAFIFYLINKTKNGDTFLNFKSLSIKHFKVDWKIITLILAIGSASFFRNSATSLFALTQQSIYASITNEITKKDPNYFVDILGAINPIYNLFFSAIIGIIRGARTVVTYNFGKNNRENVLKSFWITTIMAIVYGLIFYIIVCPFLTGIKAFNGGFLWFFGITNDSNLFNDASLLLHITMSQLIVFGLSISGMLYFQSTSKPINALLCSLMNGIIVGIPMLLIFSEIAKATLNISLYLYAPTFISIFSGIIVILYTSWYIYYYEAKKIKNKK